MTHATIVDKSAMGMLWACKTRGRKKGNKHHGKGNGLITTINIGVEEGNYLLG